MQIAKCKMKNLRDRGQGFEGSRGQDRKQMVLGSDLNFEICPQQSADADRMMKLFRQIETKDKFRY